MTVGRVVSGLVALALIGAATSLHANNPRTRPLSVAVADRKNPAAVTLTALADGKATFERECAKCHGKSGRGDGPKANEIDKKPEDLTSAKAQNQSDGGLFWKITMGKKPMPVFGAELSEEQRWKLVVYVRSLAAK